MTYLDINNSSTNDADVSEHINQIEGADNSNKPDYSPPDMYNIAKRDHFPDKIFVIAERDKAYTPITHFYTSQKKFLVEPDSKIKFSC